MPQFISQRKLYIVEQSSANRIFLGKIIYMIEQIDRMEINLTFKPKSPIIIEGFPGLGFVGTIATEYLVEKLNAKPIGYVWSEEMPPIATIHHNRLRHIFEIFYVKEKNLVLMHALSGVKGMEWKLADVVMKIAGQLKAKEMISLEGVGSPFGNPMARTFYYSNSPACEKKLAALKGPEKLTEGMIVGVTGAIMEKSIGSIKSSFIFAETHTNMPDSHAAAALIEVLNKYIGLKVDTKPLLSEAKNVEAKLKELMQKSKETKQIKDKKDISYLG